MMRCFFLSATSLLLLLIGCQLVNGQTTDNAKYYKLLDELMQLTYERWDHYRGWELGQRYVPGSIYNIDGKKRDAANSPTEITANYKNTTGNTYTVTVLLSQETPYAILDNYRAQQTQWQMNCIMPYKKVNGQYIAYQGQEKQNLQILQAKYLYNLWWEKFDETARNSNELKFLVPAEAISLGGGTMEVTEREEMTDRNGNPIGQISVPVTRTYTTASNVPGIRNTSPTHTIIKDFDWEITDNTLSIKDYSFWMRPGQIMQAFKVNPAVNNIKGMNFMIILQSSDKDDKTSLSSRMHFPLRDLEKLYSVYCSGEQLVSFVDLFKSRKFRSENGIFINNYGDQVVFIRGKGYGTDNSLSRKMEYKLRITNPKFSDSLMQDLKYNAQKLDDSTFTYDGQFLITVKDIVLLNTKYKHFFFTNNSDGHRSIIARKISSNKLEINSRTSATGIFVKAGDRITLSAEGKLKTASDEDVWVKGEFGPDGNPRHGIMNNIATYRAGALIGKIGPNGNWFLVGSSLNFTANASGELILRVNDSKPEDNSGYFIVTYSINQ